MKRIFTMLALVLLCASTWAQKTTTLLDASGDTEANWQKDGVAIFSGATPTYENGGMQMTTKNGTASLLTTLAPTENSILNIEAEFNLFSSTGRSFADGNASYFRFGNIYILENDQDQNSAYQIAETLAPASAKTFTQTGAKYRSGSITTNASYYVTMEINTATNTLTSMKVYLTKESTTPTLELTDIALPTADYTVGIGYFKTKGVLTNQVELLKSIKVTQTTQEGQVAYTVNYQYESNTVKAERGTENVGTVITATSPITIEGQKYYVDGAVPSMTVTSNKEENVLNVTLRKAYEYNYTVQTNRGGIIAEGVGTEGESVIVPYPRYINVDGTLYTKGATNKEYRYTFTPTVNNQVVTLDYTATDITNVVYFSEGEHINGATATSAGNNMVIRSSNSACGYATKDIVLTTLAPGKYTVKTVLYSNSRGGVSLKFGYGAQEFTASETTANNWAERSNDINVISSTDFVWKASGGAKDGLDFIYIQRTGDATASISLPYTYTTFSSTAALDFTNNNDVEAYMAQVNGDGTAVTLEQVRKVPAGAGVVLKKISGAETTTVKVLADAAALAGNQLVGVTEDNTVSADQLIEAGNAYVLVKEQFCKVVTGATGYIPAGKAYLSVPVRNAAKALRLDFNGTPTEVVSVAAKAEKAQDAIYNVQGIRVQKPTVPGLYIVNGKTYRF